MKEIKTRNESKFIAQSQQWFIVWHWREQSPRWDVVLDKGTQIFYKNYPFHVIRHRNTWRSSPGGKIMFNRLKKNSFDLVLAWLVERTARAEKNTCCWTIVLCCQEQGRVEYNYNISLNYWHQSESMSGNHFHFLNKMHKNLREI